MLYLLTKPEQKTAQSYLFGLCAFVVFVGMGGFFLTWNDESLDKAHILRFEKNIDGYQGKICSFISEREAYFYADLAIELVRADEFWYKKKGKIRVYFRKDSLLNVPQYGDRLVAAKTPLLLKAAGNPDGFDYQKYLQKQNIYHQSYLGHQDFICIENQPASAFLAHIYQLRAAAQRSLQAHLSPDSYAVASALLLGIKDGLSADLREAYSQTGATHVLAVSGLHVGIIFQILTILLGWISKTPAFQRKNQIAILLILWVYAGLTGFAPSVLRAVLMFSLVAVGRILNRDSNIFNTLSISALFLLIANPNFLFEIGFQLSYLALFGILYLQPRLACLWKPRHKALRWTWELTTVSIAAQILTLPITLYYFHQFPTYFWLSNFIVIPLATAVLWVAAFFFVLVPWIGNVIGTVLDWLLIAMNYLTQALTQLPFSVFTEISFSLTQTIATYTFLGCLLLLLETKRFFYLPFWRGTLFLCTHLKSFFEI
jgi:competence protein ComEC